mmetsp:Transcript_20923/g.65490  ORF Transcript_20923/g.65490 Transcript_20923/m.65490 type:complete len:227 (-) Transcript_20923:399-1079(-)
MHRQQVIVARGCERVRHDREPVPAIAGEGVGECVGRQHLDVHLSVVEHVSVTVGVARVDVQVADVRLAREALLRARRIERSDDAGHQLRRHDGLLDSHRHTRDVAVGRDGGGTWADAEHTHGVAVILQHRDARVVACVRAAPRHVQIAVGGQAQRRGLVAASALAADCRERGVRHGERHSTRRADRDVHRIRQRAVGAADGERVDGDARGRGRGRRVRAAVERRRC